MSRHSAIRNPQSAVEWLPDMDLNHDKQIQSLLCYRYTIGQTNPITLRTSGRESRRVKILQRLETTGSGRSLLGRFNDLPF